MCNAKSSEVTFTINISGRLCEVGNFVLGGLCCNLYDTLRISDSGRSQISIIYQQYKRFFDDIFVIWTGSAATLCEFRRALGSADDTIKLDWGGYESQAEALDHTVVEAKRHE
jgi:hypothetical protein